MTKASTFVRTFVHNTQLDERFWMISTICILVQKEFPRIEIIDDRGNSGMWMLKVDIFADDTGAPTPGPHRKDLPGHTKWIRESQV